MNTRICAIALLLTLVPATALAHAPIRGIGDFYNGILHPLMVPAHLIVLIALGLLIGQQMADRITLAPLVFMAGLLPGLAAATLLPVFDCEPFLLPAALACAMACALKPAVKPVLILLAAALCGLLLGMDSAPADLPLRGRLMSLGGTFIGASLSLFYLALLCTKARRPWQQVGIRVVASWTAASALLVLALRLLSKKG